MVLAGRWRNENGIRLVDLCVRFYVDHLGTAIIIEVAITIVWPMPVI